MPNDNNVSVVGIIFLGAFVLTIMMMAYQDGTPFALFKKLRCKLGLHKITTKIGQLKIKKYYCQFCRMPRKHPELKAIDGGKKEKLDIPYKF